MPKKKPGPNPAVLTEANKQRLREAMPGGELETVLREATQQVEADLALEDTGWQNLSTGSQEIQTASDRILNVRTSRLYNLKDPFGKQSVRLWTDYTFGAGMTWSSEDEAVKAVLEAFWDSKENAAVLSSRGQRKSSDKLLVDGEVFFALFMGAKGRAKIRRVDPLSLIHI